MKIRRETPITLSIISTASNNGERNQILLNTISQTKQQMCAVNIKNNFRNIYILNF